MCGLRPRFRESDSDKLLLWLFACAGGAILGALAVVGPAWALETVLPEWILAWVQGAGVWFGMGAGAVWMGKSLNEKIRSSQ